MVIRLRYLYSSPQKTHQLEKSFHWHSELTGNSDLRILSEILVWIDGGYPILDPSFLGFFGGGSR